MAAAPRKGRDLVNNTTTNSNGHASDYNSAASDFIDFYQLLGADTEATTTALRRRINDLYTEAQSNRDHRNPTKRRRYEALCELLPYSRIVLLDPDKRARYDRYREQFEAGTTVPSFENMMDEIAGRIDDDLSDNSDEKIGLPGVEGDDNFLPMTPGTLSGTSSRSSDASSNPSLPRETHAPDLEPRRSGLFDKPSPRAASRAASPSVEPASLNVPPAIHAAIHADAGAQTNASANTDMNAAEMNAVAKTTTSTEKAVAPQPAPPVASRSGSTSRSGAGLIPVVYAVVALLAVALAVHFLLNQSWERSVLAGFVAGIVAYVLSNARSTQSKSGSRRPNRIN